MDQLPSCVNEAKFTRATKRGRGKGILKRKGYEEKGGEEEKEGGRGKRKKIMIMMVYGVRVSVTPHRSWFHSIHG